MLLIAKLSSEQYLVCCQLWQLVGLTAAVCCTSAAQVTGAQRCCWRLAGDCWNAVWPTPMNPDSPASPPKLFKDGRRCVLVQNLWTNPAVCWRVRLCLLMDYNSLLGNGALWQGASPCWACCAAAGLCTSKTRQLQLTAISERSETGQDHVKCSSKQGSGIAARKGYQQLCVEAASELGTSVETKWSPCAPSEPVDGPWAGHTSCSAQQQWH